MPSAAPRGPGRQAIQNQRIAPGREHLVNAAALRTFGSDKNSRKTPLTPGRHGGAGTVSIYFTTTAADLISASGSVTPCLAAAPGFT